MRQLLRLLKCQKKTGDRDGERIPACALYSEDGRAKMEERRWKSEDGRAKVEERRWKSEDGRAKMEERVSDY